MSRQAVHRGLRWYEAQGPGGLVDRSHRPLRCSHQMDPAVEVWVLETRRRNPDWGPRRLVHEASRARDTLLRRCQARALSQATRNHSVALTGDTASVPRLMSWHVPRAAMCMSDRLDHSREFRTVM